MSTLQSAHPLGAHPGPGRAEARERLSKAAYDLLVIGGGILGTSVAWHSAQSGLRVAMVDAGDFAGATSSASSKLTHGGLRYLQTGAVKPVAEIHHERRVPAKDMAPTWSTRSPSTCRSTRAARTARPSSVRASSRTRCRRPSATASGDSYTPPGAAADNPGLRADGLKAVAVYGDHQMNDARVAVMTVRAAVRSGAVVINHAEVTGLRFTHGRVTGVNVQDRLDGTEFGIDARLVINTTGPWVDHLLRMEDKGAAPRIRLSKGTHVVLKRKAPWKAAMARTRPWASGSTPMARRSGHRSSMRETTSGRRPSTTCCAAVRR